MQRWALVTAGGQGLGRAIVEALGRRGYSLFIHYRGSAQGAEQAAEVVRAAGGEAVALPADLSTGSGREGLMAEVERHLASRPLAVLVNNLGIYPLQHLLDTTLEGWEQTFGLTCTAVFHLTQLALPLLRRGAAGRVINLGDSHCDRIAAHDDATPYHIAKLGVHVLTRTYAQQLGKDGIRVNMVSPGFLESSVGTPESPLPLGRMGRFQDITAAIEFLLSEQAEYITGANLVVSGGWELG